MAQTQRINPRVDFAFKIIFEKHTDLLMGLINAVVSDRDQVQAITIKNPYNPQSRSRDKLTVLDIKAQSVKGTWFNIEVQVSDDLHYDKRSLYYWSKVYSGQLDAGYSYGELKKTISIHVLNFNMLDDKGYHNVFRIKHDHTNKAFSDMLELHYIELKKVPEDMRKIKTALDRWGALLAKAENYTLATLPGELKEDPLVEKAMGVFETTRLNDADWDAYEAQLKRLRDDISAIQTAEIRGLQKGMEKGMEKGRVEGIEKGRVEGIKDVAKAMKIKGLDGEQIAQITGLDLADITAL